MCKSVQAGLQSRISLRASKIRDLHSCYHILSREVWSSIKKEIKRLAEDQSLDKRIMSLTYWGGY